MDVKKAYSIWSKEYDTNRNRTRDLEAKALRKTLKNIDFETCLEVGCGTGKNTSWLLEKADSIESIDFSKEMLSIAKNKIKSEKVSFKEVDITKAWNFTHRKFDIVTFSLVLEHIQDLEHIFTNLTLCTKAGSLIYIGELHPFKHYSGSSAKFETASGKQAVDSYLHFISDYAKVGQQHDFSVKTVNEFFDDDIRQGIPRILMLLLERT